LYSGLPVCGLEEKIVRDLAAQGGANYRIRLRLMEQGARLEGTEDLDLRRTEYELTMKAAPGTAVNVVGTSKDASAQQELLDQRDCFIAQRIDATLRPEEIGILFLGALHHAVEKLPDDVRVVSLPERLQDSGALAKS